MTELKVAYFDCFAGISGDMIAGALLDLGLPLAILEEQLAKVGLDGYEVSAGRMQKYHIGATKFDVTVAAPEPARTFNKVRDLIEESELPEAAKLDVLAIFTRIAEAEAKVHGVPLDEVHFHEVGATDAIIDVIAAVTGLGYLGFEKIYASPIATGTGTVVTAHGVLPVPAPATLEILAGAPIYSTQIHAELATPTGAAILAHYATFVAEMPAVRPEKTGYGAGMRDLEIPNVLRVIVGELAAESDETVTLIETNIDDASAEVLGYTMETLLAQGALDVWFTPIQMKKNRPGVMLSVLVADALTEAAIDTILSETGTLGLRISKHSRVVAERELLDADTAFGSIRVKIGRHKGRITSVAPEFDDCRAAAQAHAVPLKEVFAAAQKATRRQIDNGNMQR
ncbi:MAG: nickel pincer cofactor biosynthesis protein LarC [Actinomycetota bacterium]|nr:nickel pincer cofactor biosynthesis protein LarC [Actinomycetota bacterium]